MFTGIIEELGTVESMSISGSSAVLVIGAAKVLEDVRLGDSISVNGVCLTVVSFTKSRFTVDIMPETFRNSSLSQLRPGSKVNLERAMAAGGRFGGHFVSGHIDGVGTIRSRKRSDNAVYFEIEVKPDLLAAMIVKGSVAVDGVSLTIFAISQTAFTISLIPHTFAETILSDKGAGDTVNVECDMLGKYVQRILSAPSAQTAGPKAGLTASFLEENGFI